jgi:hypothetical protein
MGRRRVNPLESSGGSARVDRSRASDAMNKRSHPSGAYHLFCAIDCQRQSQLLENRPLICDADHSGLFRPIGLFRGRPTNRTIDCTPKDTTGQTAPRKDGASPFRLSRAAGVAPSPGGRRRPSPEPTSRFPLRVGRDRPGKRGGRARAPQRTTGGRPRSMWPGCPRLRRRPAV